MQTTMKKHSRVPVRNGHHTPSLILPATMRDLGSFKEPLHLREAVYDVLGDLFGGQTVPFGKSWMAQPPWTAEHQDGVWIPPVNVRETETEVVLEAYIPGVRKNDIEVAVKNGSILILKGQITSPDKEFGEEGYLRKELRFHTFYRSFALPLEVRPDGIEACYENGILEICLKKKEEAKTFTYKVSVR